jgi:hypothetical protein
MDVTKWGPFAWKFLHATTYAYPDEPSQEDKQAMANLFNCLCNVLPCKRCQDHWRKNLRQHPVEPHLGSREDLTKWLIAMHNRVNKQTGKPTLSSKSVAEQYQDWLGTCKCASGGFTEHGDCAVSPSLLRAWLLSGILLVIIAALLYYIFICRRM